MTKSKNEEALLSLNAALEQIDEFVNETFKKGKLPLPKMVEAYYKIKSFHEDMTERLQHLGKVKQHIAMTVLPEFFRNNAVSSVTVDSIGYRATISARLMAGIVSGKKEEAIEWLKENGLADIVQEQVNAQTLSKVAKDLVEDAKELPEELFKTHMVDNISLTKVGKK